MVGVKSRLRTLHGRARDQYLKGWANRIREECLARGLEANCLGYDLDDLGSVMMLLIDFCDDLTDSECWDAIVEAIRERGGATKLEEWESAYEEYVASSEELPSDIRDLLLSDLEHMYKRGTSEEELLEYATIMLEDYEVPNAEKVAEELVAEVVGHKPKVRREIKRKKAPKKAKRKKVPQPVIVGYEGIPPVGALITYVLVSRPTRRAREVSGTVEIGDIAGHKVYLILESLADLVSIEEVGPTRAKVTVRKGWIEVY